MVNENKNENHMTKIILYDKTTNDNGEVKQEHKITIKKDDKITELQFDEKEYNAIKQFLIELTKHAEQFELLNDKLDDIKHYKANIVISTSSLNILNYIKQDYIIITIL